MSEITSPSTTIHVRIEGDVVFVRVTGSLTLADFVTISGLYKQTLREHGRLFAIFDASKMDGIDREARKAVGSASELTAVTPHVTAIFGASFAVRTLGNMIDRAKAGLGRGTASRRFFDTEAQARAYVDQERSRLVNNR